MIQIMKHIINTTLIVFDHRAKIPMYATFWGSPDLGSPTIQWTGYCQSNVKLLGTALEVYIQEGA